MVALDEGFKHDGGLGGYLSPRELGVSPKSYYRLAYDFLFNAFLIIVLLNIVFGVIIDRFAALRTQHKEKLDDMVNRCFICNIDRYTFDQVSTGGFEHHRRYEHNKWHYVYLFAHLREKPMTEYSGKELYLAMRMAKNDVSFFPSHRALTVERYKSEFMHEDQYMENDNHSDIKNSTKYSTGTDGSLMNRKLENLEKSLQRYQTSQTALTTKQNDMLEAQQILQAKQDEILNSHQKIFTLLEKMTTIDKEA